MNHKIKRYPEDKSGLLPWNAADEYLVEQFNQLDVKSPVPLLINDSNGYLAVTLNNLSPVVYSDSFINLNSVKLNCKNNNCINNVKLISDLATLDSEKKFDVVLLKLPKSVNYLKFILDQIKPFITEKTILISAGMTKHISENTRDILTQEFGSTDITRVYKKSIAFISKYEITKRVPENSFLVLTKEPEFDMEFLSLPNVFSLNRLDNGTRLLIKNLENLSGTVVDLGCGAGPIALFCKKNFPLIEKMVLADESQQAVASAKKNFENSNFDAEFIWSDGLSKLKKESVDFVVSNPPFHSETSVNMQTGLRLFKQVADVLKKKGAFILVFNKTLSYEPHLKKLFSRVEKIDKDNRFFIYRCIK